MGQLKLAATQFVQTIALDFGISARLAKFLSLRRIIMLHGVGGDTLPASNFKAGLEWLTHHFPVVALSKMVQDIAAGKPAPAGGEVAITFDDGLHNQARIAYPILKDLGVPATIFVCPGLAESEQWIWTHEARARLRRLSPAARAEVAAVLCAQSAEIDALVEWMKTLTIDRRWDAETCIRDATPGFLPTEEEQAAYDVMSWSDIRRLDPALITIGSHTVSHPILPTLSEADIQTELRQSRRMLEATLDREVSLFCYPNGSADSRVRLAAAQIYQAAVTTEEGVVPLDVDLIAMPRIPVARHLPLLAWRMYRPFA